MKTLTLIIALALSVNFCNAQDTKNGNSITITIENISNNKGHVILGLHTQDTFMKGKGIMSAESKIVDGKVKVEFKNVKAGTYAIMALHDENENYRMDFQDNGMPKESYGMSNNPVTYGPPQFESAKFELNNNDIDLNITF
jgi:uncharacterized protein (DUF2141 family)